MKPRLSKKCLSTKVSPIREIMDNADPAKLRARGLDPAQVISFAGGWVNHPSPEALRQAYRRIIDDPALFHASGGYSPISGIEAFKQALVDYEITIHGIKGLETNNITIGANSTQLTTDLLSAMLDDGDKVALLDPAYCGFPLQVENIPKSQLIRFPVMDQSFRYVAEERADEFAEFIGKERPKVVLLISPDNPTSQVPSDRFVNKTLKAVEEVGGFLLIDFAYKDLAFVDKPNYFSWTPKDNFLSVHSGSKWLRSLGRRFGWIEATPEITRALDPIQGNSILSPDTLHQLAIAGYLNSAIKDGSLKDYSEKVREDYRRSASHTVAEIRRVTGLPCLDPQGGIYTVVDVGTNGREFVERAITETGVLAVPGWGFGRSLENAVRFSYGPLVGNHDRITEGIERLGKLLNK